MTLFKNYSQIKNQEYPRQFTKTIEQIKCHWREELSHKNAKELCCV